jgi:3-dehydrosphinganine reductase
MARTSRRSARLTSFTEGVVREAATFAAGSMQMSGDPMARHAAPFDGTALVFGGSEGIGLAVAERMSMRGMAVGIVSRNAGKLEAAKERLERHASGAEVALAVADATRAPEVDQAVRQLVSTLGAPSLIVNAAGYTLPGYVDDLAASQYLAQYEANCLGVLNVVKAGLPHFRARGRGHFVATASVLGLVGMFGYSAYCASKFALVGLCLSLRAELRAENIAVSVLCPPAVDTPGFARENGIKPAEVLEMERRGGVLRAEDVARKLERALPSKRAIVLPSTGSLALAWAGRFMPELTNRLLSGSRAGARAR